MPEKKQDKIIEELKNLAKSLKFGELCVTFKVHEGEIAQGEVKHQIKKLS